MATRSGPRPSLVKGATPLWRRDSIRAANASIMGQRSTIAGTPELSGSMIIEGAVSALANTMRMYGEAQWRFRGLFNVDPEEAIDNLDRTFEMKLEAFHTLYDVSKKLFPYLDHGDTAVLIAIRNAIHHRNHLLFQSLNRRLHLEGGIERWLGASFLLASHPMRHGRSIPLSHHVRLDDLDARLDPSQGSPHLDTSLKSDRAARRFEIIDTDLNLRMIREHGARNRYPQDQIYLDLVPIFVSAVCKVFKTLKAAGIRFKGFDAETYMRPFTSELKVELRSPEFKRLRLRGWGPIDLIPG